MPPKPRRATPRKRTPAPPPARGPGGLTRRTLLLVLGAAALVALALIAASLLLAGGDDESADDATATTAVSEELLAGIPQDGTLLGDPAASVTLIEYGDFQCPICRQFAEAIFPTLVEEYVRPGRVRMEYRGLQFLGPDSEKALRHALAAGAQGRFWDVADALYGSQGDENSGWVTDDLLREIGGAIDGLDVDRMLAEADSAAVTAEIEESRRQAEAAEVPGTPWFFVQIGDEEPYELRVSSVDDFRTALDDALAG